MGLNWDKLVEERNAWVAYNFPDHTGGDPALGSVFGVVEEMGELVHHHLKQDQGIRGDKNFHEKEAKDAIGDISVYLMGVMEHYQVRPTVGLSWASPQDYNVHQRLLKAVARLANLADNQVSRKRQEDAQAAVDGIVWWLTVYCEGRGWDYAKIVQDTWDHVKQRDWQRYPETGSPPKGPANIYPPDHLTEEEQALGLDGK